jgi:hypothetical protein
MPLASAWAVGVTLVCVAAAVLSLSWPASSGPPIAVRPAAGRAAHASRAALSLLRCPPGRYLGAAAANESLARLRAHWQRLLELGYRPRDTSPAAARRAAQRGFLTYESPLWPRPAHCRRRASRPPWPIVDEPPGTCEPAGTVCDKYRISRRYRFVWHHVWKGGTTSLSPYLSCNLEALPVAGLLRRLPGPLPGYVHVGTSREPVQRFLSAFQEVYSRVRVRRPPPPPAAAAAAAAATDAAGGGAARRNATSSSAAQPPRCWHRRVPWILVAMASYAARSVARGCTEPTETLPEAALRAVVRQVSVHQPSPSPSPSPSASPSR